jgi:hypothetical protein
MSTATTYTTLNDKETENLTGSHDGTLQMQGSCFDFVKIQSRFFVHLKVKQSKNAKRMYFIFIATIQKTPHC